MHYKDFPVLIIDHELHSDTGGGHSAQEIVAALEGLGMSVIESLDAGDGMATFVAHTEISCVLVEWELGGEKGGKSSQSMRIVEGVRKRNEGIPIFIMTERHKLQDIPVEVLADVHGYVWKMEDTPNFIAGRIEKAAKDYVDSLMPPFFKAMMKYVEEYKYAWHTPGHMGGLAFLKSPAGRVFYDFFGENVFRADLSVSVPELGSLMEHAGVNGEAERYAAKTFGAEQTYFVTNGTSTANKIVNFSCVTRGDVVLIDRNCHKSLQHAITMTGGVPVYFIPARNAFGIIGGINYSEFDPATIRKKIEESPLIEDKSAPVKLAVVTNSTYDGLIYDVARIKDSLGNAVENLHFDEAWYGYAHFNPMYEGCYAMCARHDAENHPTMFATQSTHKLLAAFSQASMIHVKSGAHKVDPERFNEAFMMHTSTSPQYGIIASLDVSTKMMEGAAGKTLTQDSIDEAIVFRRKMVKIGEDIADKEKDESKRWWFNVWQPEEVCGDKAGQQACWKLKAKGAWHGYEGIEDEFMMLDPIKVSLVTPGTNIDGTMGDWGIPAPLVSKFLMSQGIVDEKTGFYTFLFLFSIGVTKGKSGTLLAELFAFKELYDRNAPLAEVYPELVAENPKRYGGVRLKELAREMHDHLKKEDIAKVTMKVFAMMPEQVMPPYRAYEELVRGNVEAVPLDEMAGRIPAVMLVPYPPGIPIIMPGERITSDTQAILEYLGAFQDFDNAFPGFETETHGVDPVKEGDRIRYYVNCIKK
jgi:lysine decarboxylase/arginine decarboxylase